MLVLSQAPRAVQVWSSHCSPCWIASVFRAQWIAVKAIVPILLNVLAAPTSRPFACVCGVGARALLDPATMRLLLPLLAELSAQSGDTVGAVAQALGSIREPVPLLDALFQRADTAGQAGSSEHYGAFARAAPCHLSLPVFRYRVHAQAT